MEVEEVGVGGAGEKIFNFQFTVFNKFSIFRTSDVLNFQLFRVLQIF